MPVKVYEEALHLRKPTQRDNTGAHGEKGQSIGRGSQREPINPSKKMDEATQCRTSEDKAYA